MGYWSERQIWEGERGFHAEPGQAVCAACVPDEALQRLVAENVAYERCDFCEREAGQAIAADCDLVLERIATSLRSEYTNPLEILSYDSEEGEWAGAPTYDFEDVVEQVAERPLGHERFDTFVVDAFRESEWCARDPFGLTASEALRYGWEQLRETVQHRQRFFFIGEGAVDEDPRWPVPAGGAMLEELGRLLREHELVAPLPASTTLYRVRLHGADERYTTAKDLGSPPARRAAQSRMSPAGIPMFYAADDLQTALDETIDPERTKAQAASVGVFKTTEEMRIVDLSRLPELPSIFDDRPVARAARGPLGFLHGFECDVSAPIERDDRVHIDYVPTQVVSEYLRHRFRDEQGRPVRGLAWDSARRLGARNVVLFIDRERCVELGERPPRRDGLLVELVDHKHQRITSERPAGPGG